MERCESSCSLPENSGTGSAWRSKQSRVVLFTWDWLRDCRLIWKTIWTIFLKSFSVERGAKREGQLCEQSWWAENTFFLPTFLHFSFLLPYAYWELLCVLPHQRERNLSMKERDQEISTRLKSRKFVSSLEGFFFFFFSYCGRIHMGFPSGVSGKEPTCQCGRCKRHGFDPWVRKIPWRRAWQPTPVFLPGESHG